MSSTLEPNLGLENISPVTQIEAFFMVNKDGVTTLRTLLKIAGGKEMSFFSPKPKKVW